VNRRTTAGRATLERKPVQIIDVLADPEFGVTPAHRAEEIRTVLSVPMLSKGEVIGVVNAWRHEVRPFSDKQIRLLETFARQAVIAIDNVRLFKELESRNRDLGEALEQQTATAEILRVISSSPTDAGPVFDTIVSNALQLCDANFVKVYLFNGERLCSAAHSRITPAFEALVEQGLPLNRGTTAGRAALEKKPVQIPDILADPEFEVTPGHRAEGIRTVLAVPMVRDEALVGVIATWRREVRPFSDKQIRLLETFARQAVIAIDNVRLFKELESRNRDLGEALEQQTATAEILRAISSAPVDVVPVFETIARRAVSLCRSLFANVFLFDGELLHCVASHQTEIGYVELLRTKYPMRPDRSQVSGRVILDGAVVRLEDALADSDYDQRFPAAMSWRRMLGVPMLREGKPIGTIVVGWAETGPVPKAQEELLTTFADQAVIALENVRLLRELRDRNNELSLANQAKSRFLAAASHDLRQPMHALALFVDQLRSSRARADRIALTRRIEEAVGSLSELLDQLLDLSKLEAGAVQVLHQDFAVEELLAAIDKQFAPLAHAKGIELRVVPSSAWLRSDPVLVQRIMSNLVANAIRYTERGGVLIGCRKHGGRLRLAVWDTGCGIPDDRREDVFREFVQLGPADVRRTEGPGRGLGLGLAIVARLADLLGASIELRSNVGRGSTFAFDLPVGAPGAAAQEVAPQLRVSDLRGTFVLVIDDDETARAGMCGLLQRWGCLTQAAADGNEAIALLQAHDRPPELIVSDYRLATAETGLDAIARVRRAVDEHVPAIIVTADTSREVFDRAQAGAIPLLHKPVSPIKLRALLAGVLFAADDRERAAA
jgi:signal transduction histidine kinase/CheY-like chemotaxis protein